MEEHQQSVGNFAPAYPIAHESVNRQVGHIHSIFAKKCLTRSLPGEPPAWAENIILPLENGRQSHVMMSNIG